MVVTIDGPAGSGKSTIARNVAQKLGFRFLNSGAYYRAATLLSIRDKTDETLWPTEFLCAHPVERAGRFYLEGKDVTSLLYSDEIDYAVSRVAAYSPLRDTINDLLRRVTKGINVVAEGRDMATVAFPDAVVKIYLDADVRSRAERRYRQGTSNLSVEEIAEQLQIRDENDRNRATGSLRRASDAVYLDTSDLTVDEVCERVIGIIRTIPREQEQRTNHE